MFWRKFFDPLRLSSVYAPRSTNNCTAATLRREFDNWQVWGGNLTIEIDGRVCEPPLARAYIKPGETPAIARVRCELFVAAVDPYQVQPRDVDARLWTDASGANDYVEIAAARR